MSLPVCPSAFILLALAMWSASLTLRGPKLVPLAPEAANRPRARRKRGWVQTTDLVNGSPPTATQRQRRHVNRLPAAIYAAR